MKRKIKIFSFIAFILYTFSSCITTKQTDMLQNIAKEYPKATLEQYKIIPGDRLSITIYSLDADTRSLFSEYSSSQFVNVEGAGFATSRSVGDSRTTYGQPITVYADGTIDFPYIGQIYVSGLTILETRKLLSEKLDAFYVGTSADVQLQNKFFSVLGELGARRVPMDNDKITIFQALASGNYINTYGDRSKVSILRQTEKGTTIKTFDLRSKDIIDSDYYYIQANDVIYIPQSKARFFGGSSSFTGIIGWGVSLLAVFIYITKSF